MSVLITVLIIIFMFSILGFIFRSAIKLIMVSCVIFVLFVLFFGDGSSIVSKITPFLKPEEGQAVEDFYSEFKDRTNEIAVVDTDKIITSIKNYVTGTINEEKLKEDLKAYAGKNLTDEKLSEGVEAIKASIKEGTVTEDLKNFITENFTGDKAVEFLITIKKYLHE